MATDARSKTRMVRAFNVTGGQTLVIKIDKNDVYRHKVHKDNNKVIVEIVDDDIPESPATRGMKVR